jgi:hypothetical protein
MRPSIRGFCGVKRAIVPKSQTFLARCIKRPILGMSIASPNAAIQKIALIPKKKISTARPVGAGSRRQAADPEVSPFLPVSRLRRSRALGRSSKSPAGFVHNLHHGAVSPMDFLRDLADCQFFRVKQF